MLDGHPVDGLRRKDRALFFYLAAEKGPIPRESLLTFFWPDHERASAQPILRTMIHELRKQLGETFQADDHSIARDRFTKPMKCNVKRGNLRRNRFLEKWNVRPTQRHARIGTG